MRNTSYAREIKRAEVGEARIERLYVHGKKQEEIRFSWWKDGRLRVRPLDLTEDHLIELIEDAVLKGVFSEKFLRQLHALLYDSAKDAKYTI